VSYELELLDVGALPLAPGARVRVAPHLPPAVAVVAHRRRRRGRRRRRRRLVRERCEASSGEGTPLCGGGGAGDRGLGQDSRPARGPRGSVRVDVPPRHRPIPEFETEQLWPSLTRRTYNVRIAWDPPDGDRVGGCELPPHRPRVRSVRRATRRRRCRLAAVSSVGSARLTVFRVCLDHFVFCIFVFLEENFQYLKC